MTRDEAITIRTQHLQGHGPGPVLLEQAIALLKTNPPAPKARTGRPPNSLPRVKKTPAEFRAERAATPVSEREAEVMGLLIAGDSHKTIGAVLGIATKTVCAHVAHVRDKLGARTVLAAAVAWDRRQRPIA